MTRCKEISNRKLFEILLIEIIFQHNVLSYPSLSFTLLLSSSFISLIPYSYCQPSINPSHMNIQLMQEFLRAPFLVLHFSYYTLMTFLMLSVILLSMLTILLSILSVIVHLICGNNLNWLLNLSLI